MIRKEIPYGVTSKDWTTGVGITNSAIGQQCTIRFCGKDGTRYKPIPISLRPREKKGVLFPAIGVVSALISGAYNFKTTLLFGAGKQDWSLVEVAIIPEPDVIPAPGSNVMVCISEKSLFHHWIGNCGYLPKRNLWCLERIFEQHYYETGAMTIVEDLNTRTSHCPNHPDESHNGRDGDIRYDEDIGVVWNLMRWILRVFSQCVIQVHETIWNELNLKMTGEELLLYEPRIKRDTNPQWRHDEHFHIAGLGGEIDEAALPE